MVAFAAIAGITALAAAGASAYVKGQSAKGMARRVKSLREQQAARADRAGQDLDFRTRKTSDEFKPEERTALTEKNDQENRDTLARIHDDLETKNEEGSDQKFKGKISQGFKDKLAAERGTTKERSAALREAQAQFNSPVQAGQEEANLLQNLGIDNYTIKSFMRGDQRAIDAKIAGLKPGGQGLAQFLDTLALVAAAASLGAGSFGGASSGASAVNPGQLALNSGGTITNIGQAGNSAANIGSFAGGVGGSGAGLGGAGLGGAGLGGAGLGGAGLNLTNFTSGAGLGGAGLNLTNFTNGASRGIAGNVGFGAKSIPGAFAGLDPEFFRTLGLLAPLSK